MHPHIPRPRRKATRTCTDTAGVVRTVHGEFMWPFTARVNENRTDRTDRCRCNLPPPKGRPRPDLYVRFTPKSGHWNPVVKCPLCAKSRHSVLRKKSLFDHLVGAGEQRLRDDHAERFGGLEVDHEHRSGRSKNKRRALSW